MTATKVLDNTQVASSLKCLKGVSECLLFNAK